MPANIAEGFKQFSAADKIRFYNIAQGSLEEVRYCFILCRDLKYRIEYDSLNDQADHIGRMLTNLMRAIRC